MARQIVVKLPEEKNDLSKAFLKGFDRRLKIMESMLISLRKKPKKEKKQGVQGLSTELKDLKSILSMQSSLTDKRLREATNLNDKLINALASRRGNSVIPSPS